MIMLLHCGFRLCVNSELPCILLLYGRVSLAKLPVVLCPEGGFGFTIQHGPL